MEVSLAWIGLYRGENQSTPLTPTLFMDLLIDSILFLNILVVQKEIFLHFFESNGAPVRL